MFAPRSSQLAFRKVDESGLASTKKEERQQRTTVVLVYGAPEGLEEALEDEWCTATPNDAYEKLSSPDIIVSNQKDKEDQLPLIEELDQKSRQGYKLSMQAREQGVLQDIRRVHADQASSDFSVTPSVSKARTKEQLELAKPPPPSCRAGVSSSFMEDDASAQEAAQGVDA